MEASNTVNARSNTKEAIQKSLKALDIQRKSLEQEADAIVSELNSTPQGSSKPIGLNTPLVDNEGYPRNDIDVYRVRHLRSRFHEIQTDHKQLMKRVENGLKQLSMVVKPQTQEQDEHEKKARMAPRPKPKFDPVSGKWVVTNWNGTIAGIPNGHLRSFDNMPKNKENGQPSTSSDQLARPSSSFNAQSTTFSTVNEARLTKNGSNESDSNDVNLLPFALVDEVAPNSPASNAGLKAQDLIVKFGTATYSNHRQLRAIAELVPLAAAEEKGIPIIVLRAHRSERESYGSGNDSCHDGTTEKDGSKTVCLIIRPQPWNGRGLIGCHIKPYAI